MAEIKSAIELAMERTKDLIVDREERQALALKDTENRIRGLVRRFTEEMISGENAVKGLDEINVDKSLKQGILLDAIVEGFDVKAKNERLFALLDLIGVRLPDSLRREFDDLQGKVRDELEKRRMIVRQRIRTDLAEMGITGAGIEPNYEVWDEWKEAADETSNIVARSMQAWREEVKASGKTP